MRECAIDYSIRIGRRVLPREARRSLKQWFVRRFRYRQVGSQSGTYVPPTNSMTLKKGVNVVGHFLAENGVGQGARAMVSSLQAAQVPHSLVNYKVGCYARSKDDTFTSRFCNTKRHLVNLLHMNASQMPLATLALREKFFRGHYNIGYWAWELPEFPDEWISSFDKVAEVWAPSRFVVDAIAEKSPRPVLRIPHAIGFDVPKSPSRTRFGLPEQHFLFLTMLDLWSVPARKNPEALIDAFAKTFSHASPVSLVIKVNGSGDHIREFKKLQQYAATVPNVILLDETLSRQDVYALQLVCDCFVSLHRSEGFGLGLAECMYLGKPVIGTNWSGNTDFMTPQNSCAVDYSLVRLDRDHGPYKRGQYWAEPDVDHAAWFMKKLVEDSQYGKQIAASGQETIVKDFSYQVIGDKVRRRLDAILDGH